MRSDIKSCDGKVIDRISILFHRKVEFLLTNEYIMILIQSLRQVKSYLLLNRKCSIILTKIIKLHETSITKIDKGNLNSILIIVIENIVINFFSTRLILKYVNKSIKPNLGVSIYLYDPTE